MTDLQMNLIVRIARNDNNEMNGHPIVANHTVTYAECVLESKEDGGVFSSLVQAGLAEYQEEGKDSLIWLTEKGFDAYCEFAEI